MQNEYDSPQQQMSRLQQAGLNPNLVYGGNTVGNTSSSAPRMEAPNANIQPVDYQSVLLTHQSIEKMKADTDSVRAQTENTIQQTAINKSMAIIDLAQKEINRDISSKERDYWYNIKEAELQNLQANTKGTQANTLKTQGETGLQQYTKENIIANTANTRQQIKESQAKIRQIAVNNRLTEVQIQKINAEIPNILETLNLLKANTAGKNLENQLAGYEAAINEKLVKTTGLDKITIKEIIDLIFRGQDDRRQNLKQATTAIAPLVL